MCGFAGFLPSTPHQDAEKLCHRMLQTLVHRGPDDAGIWFDPSTGLVLGHRRLSILDLSPEGHQPMVSASKRYVISYNGEVYNCRMLQKELRTLGYEFRGHSDTEVMLAAIEEWGVEKAVQKFIGMFAFALWDCEKRELVLIRDRIGIKPLYYGLVGNSFVFGSELKALKEHPGFDNPIDRDALCLYFRYNCVPAPYSIYKNIFKLEPGTILRIKYEDFQKLGLEGLQHQVYWSLPQLWQEGAKQMWKGSEEEIIKQLEELLRDAVSLRMLSDVPLGAFLSGGIDSSAVVALMQELSSTPVKTFAIGFNEGDYNEAHHAKEVAKYLGTDHTELYVTHKDLLEVIPQIPTIWNEPFADSSQIPTFLVSKLARKHVTVSLSGDGGDELFSGYTRYFKTASTWKTANKIPLVFRKNANRFIRVLPARLLENLGNAGYKLQWRGDLMGRSDFSKFYQYFRSHQKNPHQLVLNTKEPEDIFDKGLFTGDESHTMSLLDLMTYLPDDILTKVDRASMAVSLEARVPLLDHRVIEFAAKIPTALKVEQEVGKVIFRKLLYRHVPQKLLERPKMGFGVPIDSWLRKELRDWAEHLLDEKTLQEQGFLNTRLVRTLWKQHLSGKYQWHYYLWDILMFQQWLEFETSK
ncbi:asparagine synthase (glutamine-hydrolyzing) [Deltaproteobacteria bacterium TL4]